LTKSATILKDWHNGNRKNDFFLQKTAFLRPDQLPEIYMKKTILTVDDSMSVRKFIALSLKSGGYRVISAVDGMDALEILSKEKVDLVITDLNMPNVDGFELVRAIRQNTSFSDLPIIILSSLADAKYIERGMQAGANSYIVKPFNMKKIQYEVSKYI
jgi:two-component system chemotaxis response regulator CheY